MTTYSFSLWFYLCRLYLLLKMISLHEDQRAVSRRKVSHCESKERAKVNLRHFTNIGCSQYRSFEFPEKERIHWCTEHKQVSNVKQTR